VHLAGVSAHPCSAQGNPTGPQPGDRGPPRGDPLSHPRSRRQVRGAPRWGVEQRGRAHHPYPAPLPQASAFAARCVKTVRRECLGHLPIFGERHLQWVLREYLRHYNEERPHRGLSLETPEPGAARHRGDGVVVRVDRLGGLIHEYHRTAAWIGI